MIARFVDREPLLDIPGARRAYTERLARGLQAHDARLYAFSLMSTHVHLVLRRVHDPLGGLFERVHTGFSLWVRAVKGGLGSVFAGRFKSIPVEAELAPILLAYVHNNETRAGLVATPGHSRWSTHRYFQGTRAAPSWLRVAEALDLSGFDATRAGRVAFDEMVHSRSSDPRLDAFAKPMSNHERVRELESAGIPVLRSTKRAPSTTQTNSADSRWSGRPTELIRAASRVTGICEQVLRSNTRVRPIPTVRGVMLVAWRQELGRPMSELVRVLGIASSSASEAFARSVADSRQVDLARELALRCRQEPSET